MGHLTRKRSAAAAYLDSSGQESGWALLDELFFSKTFFSPVGMGRNNQKIMIQDTSSVHYISFIGRHYLCMIGSFGSC